MKKILWLSRHLADGEQLSELCRIFGSDAEVIPISPQIKTGKEVINLMQSNNCSEVVAVLPPHLIAEILDEGYEPIRAVMNREIHEDGTATFSFSHFERVKKIEIITERL